MGGGSKRAAPAPWSDPVRVIFVKLWPFRVYDRVSVAPPPEAGAARRSLSGNESARVWEESWAPGAEIRLENPDGLEIFVISGAFSQGEERFERWPRLRRPPVQALGGFTGPEDVRLGIKAGPLTPNVCAL